jgi:long-chain acyl-CoA synthetase
VRTRVEQYGDSIVTFAKDEDGIYRGTTYKQFWNLVGELALGLIDLGVTRDSHVGIISDNRPEWLRTDLAILSVGAADVPRGSDATKEEIAYILAHADCSLAFIENGTQAEKVFTEIGRAEQLKSLILYDEDPDARSRGESLGYTMLQFSDVAERGAELYRQDPDRFRAEVDAGTTDDLATLLYTSGTTGEPKGVMLTHRSFLFQMDRIKDILLLDETDIFLSVLPIWHSFERAVEYIVLNYAAAIAYSKPVGQVMLEDMSMIRPTWMTSVPRIWEGVRAAVYRNARKQSAVRQLMFHFFVGVGQLHAAMSNMLLGRVPQFRKRSRILDGVVSFIPLVLLSPLKLLGDLLVFKKLRDRLGGRFVAGVSGGGALPPYVDSFFQAAGIKLLEGYGLTETGPVLAVRQQRAPIPGTVGTLLPDIEHRVVAEDGRHLPPGEKGVLHVKSEQVMLGYYKKPDETAKVLEDGWLNTGDLTMFTHDGEFTILGRAKDTIVLLGGENVEPQPIEDKLVQSDYIDQAMVVGQDMKFLGALIVPNEEKLVEFAAEQGIDYVDVEELREHEEVKNQIRKEIESLVNGKTGFKLYEQVYRISVLSRPFEVGRELTNSLKKRRNVIYDLYRHEISALFR